MEIVAESCHIAAKGPAMPLAFERIYRHGHALKKNELTNGISQRTFLKKLPAQTIRNAEIAGFSPHKLGF